jgi:hypothetical protein
VGSILRRIDARTLNLCQKNCVKSPHKLKLPSSTNQSEAVNPNNLPSLNT